MRNHIYCFGYAVNSPYSNVEFPHFSGGSTPEPYFKFKGGWRGRDKLSYFILHSRQNAKTGPGSIRHIGRLDIAFYYRESLA